MVSERKIEGKVEGGYQSRTSLPRKHTHSMHPYVYVCAKDSELISRSFHKFIADC